MIITKEQGRSYFFIIYSTQNSLRQSRTDVRLYMWSYDIPVGLRMRVITSAHARRDCH